MPGRPPLPIGAHGVIRLRPQGDQWRATTHYRDVDGVTRQVVRIGRSRSAADRRLKEALAARTGPAGGDVTAGSRLRDVAAMWLATVDAAAETGARSPNTARLYRGVADRHVLPVVGDLRLAEATVTRCDRCVAGISSPSTARTARVVLSGVLGYAVRHGALTTNPVREVARIEGGPAREPRALTVAEREAWLAGMEADPAAVRHDIPDLTRMLLATGARIGEVLAVSHDDVDLTAGTVAVDWQITRVTGRGLVRRRRKAERGQRRSMVLRLPTWAVSMLRRRRLAAGGAGPVFGDSLGGWRDPSNTSKAIREARARVPGFGWVTSHVFRKTVATIMDDSGVPVRVISDQLNHTRVSMTQDVYLGRRTVADAAVAALESADPDRVSGDQTVTGAQPVITASR